MVMYNIGRTNDSYLTTYRKTEKGRTDVKTYLRKTSAVDHAVDFIMICLSVLQLLFNVRHWSFNFRSKTKYITDDQWSDSHVV